MGKNNLTTKSGGDVIAADDPNQYKEALGSDLVPRNKSGVPTDEGGNVGTATYKFAKGYIKELVIGAIASQLEIKEVSGKLAIYVGGNKVGEFDSSGFLGSFIKNGTVGTNQLTNLSVTTGKIAALAVTGQKIGNGEIIGGKLSDFLITKRKLSLSHIQDVTLSSSYPLTTSWQTLETINQSYNGPHNFIFGICQVGATDIFGFNCTSSYDLRLISNSSTVVWQASLTSTAKTYEYPIIGIGQSSGVAGETFELQAKSSAGTPTLTVTDAKIFLL